MFPHQPERPSYSQPDVSPQRLRFIREQQDFQPVLADVLHKEPQIDTMRGVSSIGYMLNDEFYRQSVFYNNLRGPGKETAFEGKIWQSQIECGIAIPATMLREHDVDLGYQTSKLNQWLNLKGLQGRSSEDRVRWSEYTQLFMGTRGVGFGLDTGLDPSTLGYGALASMADYMAAETVRFASRTGGLDRSLFLFASAAAKGVGLELEHLVETGVPMNREVYRAILERPAQDVGIELVDTRLLWPKVWVTLPA
jgi:hypothetical protein